MESDTTSVSDSQSERQRALDSLLLDFQKRKIDPSELWSRLQTFIYKCELSRDERRQILWDALPAKEKEELVAQCPYFCPQNIFWSIADKQSAEKLDIALTSYMRLLTLAASFDRQEKICSRLQYWAPLELVCAHPIMPFVSKKYAVFFPPLIVTSAVVHINIITCDITLISLSYLAKRRAQQNLRQASLLSAAYVKSYLQDIVDAEIAARALARHSSIVKW